MDDLSLVRDHTVLSVVVGSRAYGEANPTVLECLWTPLVEKATACIDAWRESLTRELDTAASGGALPAEPDRARVEDFLVSVRRRGAR